jgi:excisionase family DNA binding protein
MAEYLTTGELAELLRIGERKVYDLAASGEVPCTRATGKLLFPREQVMAWLARHSSGPGTVPLPDVFLGSHDPLLDWAIRESRCGIAALFDSSADGLQRFAARQGIATGLHIPGPDGWNIGAVRETCGTAPAVLVGWAARMRGLILGRDCDGVGGLADLAGRRLAMRQPEAGAQKFLLAQLAEAGLKEDDVFAVGPVRSETEAVLLVQEGVADAAFGLESLAAQYRLPFVPVAPERFDLLVDRRSWFEPALQRLFDFAAGKTFRDRAAGLAGCEIPELGRVRYNGP